MKPIVTAHDAHAAIQKVMGAGDVAELDATQLQDQRRALEDILASVHRCLESGTIGEWAAYRLSGQILGRLQGVAQQFDVVGKLEGLAAKLPAAARR